MLCRSSSSRRSFSHRVASHRPLAGLGLITGLLLLGGCGTASSKPPALVLVHPTVEAGDLAPDEVSAVRVPWRRVGRGPLRVLAVESDCACAVARGPEGRVEEGACGVLKILVHGPRRLGAFVQRVRVFTDQPPPRDVVTLRVGLHSRDRVAVLPHLLDVGRRSPGARVERDVEVRLDPALVPGFPGGDPSGGAEGLRVRLVGLQGAVRLLPPVRVDLPGRRARLTLRAPKKAGDFDGRILVLWRGEQVASAQVRGWVDADP